MIHLHVDPRFRHNQGIMAAHDALFLSETWSHAQYAMLKAISHAILVLTGFEYWQLQEQQMREGQEEEQKTKCSQCCAIM